MRRWHGRSWVAVCFVAALSGGCNGASAPARGFGSRQVVSTRDPTVALVGYANDHVLLFSTGTICVGDLTFFSVDLSTGQVQDLGPKDPTTAPVALGADAGPLPFTCAETSSPTGEYEFTITDTQSGQTVTIVGVTWLFPPCPTVAHQVIVVWRRGAGGEITLWAGPFDQLARVATDLVIHAMVSGDAATITVLAARTGEPSALGLFAIDVATFVTTEVLAPALGAAAFADGATAAGALASDTLDVNFWVFSVGDHFFYARAMSDGSSMYFVGPLATGAARELALFPAYAGALATSRIEPFGSVPGEYWPLLPAWDDSGPGGNVLRYWDDTGRRLISCNGTSLVDPLVGKATRDGRRLLFSIDSMSTLAQGGGGHAAPLLLMSLDAAVTADACSLVAARDVASAGFSPGGTSMFWVTRAATGRAAPWTAAADGTGARQLGAADAIYDVHFIDDTRLELGLDLGMAWLDVTEAGSPLHFIAEKVFGQAFDPPGPWLVTGYDHTEQDANGMLGLVNRDTGAKRPISPAVTVYWVLPPWAPPGSGLAIPQSQPSRGVPASTAIAYLVRGRNPSAQDGLWLATITAEDLR